MCLWRCFLDDSGEWYLVRYGDVLPRRILGEGDLRFRGEEDLRLLFVRVGDGDRRLLETRVGEPYLPFDELIGERESLDLRERDEEGDWRLM